MNQSNQHQPGQSSHSANQPPPQSSSRRPKVLLIVLLLVILAAGLAWFIVADQDESDDPAASEGVEITTTAEAGFLPGTVLITPDTTVTWLNQGDEPVWVASNPHPDHDGLPGLDAGEPIFPGETYSYTFTETGEHSYHDHLNPETNGTVIVE